MHPFSVNWCDHSCASYLLVQSLIVSLGSPQRQNLLFWSNFILCENLQWGFACPKEGSLFQSECLDEFAQKRFILTPLVLNPRGFGDRRCMNGPIKVSILSRIGYLTMQLHFYFSFGSLALKVHCLGRYNGPSMIESRQIVDTLWHLLKSAKWPQATPSKWRQWAQCIDKVIWMIAWQHVACLFPSSVDCEESGLWGRHCNDFVFIFGLPKFL